MTFNNRYSGSFTSTATPDRHDVALPQGQPDEFFIKNRTKWGNDASVTAVRASWFRGMASGAAETEDQAVTTGILSTNIVTANGFTFIDTANPPVFTANALDDITKADPAVADVTSSTGSISVGDVVRIINPTGMLQVGGYEFSVTAISTDSSVTLNFDSSNEAAAATAGSIKLIMPSRFYPRWRYIVPVGGLEGIDQASQCIVCTSVYHDFSVGERVSFRVSSAFGMSEINNRSGIVQSIGNASGSAYSTAVASNYNALQIDLDTSGFTAFALPASAVAAAGVSPAIILPAGAGPYPNAADPYVPTTAAFDNRNKYIMRIGTNVITAASSIYDWVAYYSTEHTAE